MSRTWRHFFLFLRAPFLANVFSVPGVRAFTPRNASAAFLYVGGPAVALSMVAMVLDDSSLYAAVKVLASVLETNSAMQQEMKRIDGYKVRPAAPLPDTQKCLPRF